MENEQATLRDTLEASFDAVAEQPDTAEEKEQRARDEAGRFAKAEEAKIAAPPASSSPAPAVPPAPEVAAPKPRPSSWKKDFDPHWEKFDPTVQDYILQREREYANGVSTYKSEAENARQLNEAIAPFLPNLQKHGMEPTQWIKALGTAHEALALGSPQQKVQTFATLLNQYGVDPQHLFQMLSGQQPQFQQPQNIPPPDIERIVEEKLTQKEVNQEYQRFIAEAKEKYPHFEAVKETMAGLLQAELAQDYKSAYEAALRHPRHADIFEAIQKQEREQMEAQAKAEAAAKVSSARGRAVSVKSSTPSGTTTTSANKSLRESLMDSFDQVQARV